MMFHVVYRNKSNPAEEVGQMEQIEVKVTCVPRAGQTVLLIECSVCGPVAVDSRVGSSVVGTLVAGDPVVASGADHLLTVHGQSVVEVRQ